MPLTMKKLQLGSCVYYVSSNGIEHPYYIITEPQGETPKVLAVNITEYAEWKEQTLILEDGHSAITKRSVVNYRFIEEWDVQKIEAEINDGECRTMLHYKEPVCTPELVSKLRKGLQDARTVPQKIKDYLND